MRENRFFVRSADLDGLSPNRIAGRAVFLGYGDVIDRLERLVGASAASLFAEPVLPRGSTGDVGAISWYTSYPGTVVEIDEIDEVARKPVAEKLAARLAALAPALADPEIGGEISSWLTVSAPKDFLSVGGEPVLVNWGLLPNAVSSREQRAEHFAKTFGRFGSTFVARSSGAAPSPRGPIVLPNAPGRPAVETIDGRSSSSEAIGSPKSRAEERFRPRLAAAGAQRPWLAPSIASGLAALALLLLALPGVLVYPDAPPDDAAADRFDEQRLKASNDSLELQLKALDDAVGEKVCRPANFTVPVPGLFPGPGEGRGGGASPAAPLQMRIDPKPPEQAELPRSPARDHGGAETVSALLEKTTVLVIAFGETRGDRISYSQGTGFLIDDRHIVTNHHVVRKLEGDRLFVANKSLGGVRQAKIVARSEPPPVESDVRVDLAVLEIEPVAGLTGLALGSTPPKLATAYVAGFPGFLTEHDVKFQAFLDTLASGVFNPTEADRALARQNIEVPSVDMEAGRINNEMNSGSGALPILLHDMVLAKGNSGGPLIDACGRLIGVNTLLFSSGAGARQGNVAQDVSTLRKFLDDNHVTFRSDDSACATEDPASTRPQASASPTSTPSPAPTATAP